MAKLALAKDKIRFLLPILLGLTLILTFFASCSWRNPTVRKQKYYNSAMDYFAKAEYRQAAIQLQNAIKIDPEYVDAHYQLAQCYVRLRMGPAAFAELNRTIELAPKNWKAQIDMGNALLADQHAQQGADKAKLVLEADPQNVDAHTLMANSLAAMGNSQGALDEMQVAIRIAPNQSSSYLNLALLQVNAKQLQAAEDTYKKAIALDPRSATPLRALGDFYASQGQFQPAEQEFLQAIQIDPRDLAPRRELVRVYLVEQKQNEAIEALKQMKLALSDNSEAYRMLGDFYAQTGQMDKGLAEYASLYRDHPKDHQVRTNYVKLLIDSDRLEEAGKLNDGFLQGNPTDPDALIARAEIWLEQGRTNDAIALFQSTLKTDPNNASGHYNLGIAHSKAGSMEQAEKEWREAVRLQPDLVLAHQALAEVGLRKNDLDLVEKSAEAVIGAQPVSPVGYNIRAVLESRRGDNVKAEADLKKAMELAPRDPRAYTRLGEIRANQKKFQEAEALYEQALSVNPAFTEALGSLLTIYSFENKPVNIRISRIQDQIARVPKNGAYYRFLGQVFFNHQDYPNAEPAFQKAVELDPNDVAAFVLLADAQAGRGSIQQAVATAELGVQQNPHDLRIYALLGLLQEKSGDWQRAEDTYRKAMLVDPAFGLAANNLACLLMEHGGNPDMALSLAQIARNTMPQSPVTADTLAWAYFQKGVYGSAVDLLNKTVTQEPNSPTVHYHLGMTYLRMKNTAAANAQFRQVLKLDPGYVKGPEIRKMLAETGKG